MYVCTYSVYGPEFLEPLQLSSSGGRCFSEGAKDLAQRMLSDQPHAHMAVELLTWFVLCR